MHRSESFRFRGGRASRGLAISSVFHTTLVSKIPVCQFGVRHDLKSYLAHTHRDHLCTCLDTRRGL